MMMVMAAAMTAREAFLGQSDFEGRVRRSQLGEHCLVC